MAGRSIRRWVAVAIGVTALVLATEVARPDPGDTGTPVVGNPAIVHDTVEEEEEILYPAAILVGEYVRVSGPRP